MMITAAAVKRRIKEIADVNVSGDLMEPLNREVDAILKRAVNRCQANGRKTVRSSDL